MTPVAAATGRRAPSPPPPPTSSSSRSIVVRRAPIGVVVTVQGHVDGAGAEILERVLSDLIEGQGNLSVVVDLAGADIGDRNARAALRVPADQARRRGAAFSVLRPDAGVRVAASA